MTVGVAVLPEDGHNAAALIDTAEKTRFAAAANGSGIVTGGGGDGGSKPPAHGPTLVS